MQTTGLKPLANPSPAGGGSPGKDDKYVYVKARVMLGPAHICVAASTNMARRISNALAAYSEPAAGVKAEFWAIRTRVVRVTEHIALAPNASLAQMIASALNHYQPGDRGY
jgi:hypothetical protein